MERSRLARNQQIKLFQTAGDDGTFSSRTFVIEDFLSEGSFGARIAKVEFEFDTIKTSVEKHLKKVREISDRVEAEGKAIEQEVAAWQEREAMKVSTNVH